MTANVKAKVLIVDDDPSIVRVLAAHCTELGLEVQTAGNGLQAILRATRNPPRVVLLDLQMPEADGFRVCEWLRESHRPFVDIIVLTARADDATVARCKSLHVSHVLKGPTTWEHLRAILGTILDLEDAPAPPADFRWMKAVGPELLTDRVRNKVLVVDDDTDLTAGLAHRLRKCGALTVTASDGVSGYRTALREQPDVIVADYTMPDGSGHYMIWRLKSTEATKHIPVIVISGQKADPDRHTTIGRDPTGLGGPVRHFQKPLDVDALFTEVARHCAITYRPFDLAS